MTRAIFDDRAILRCSEPLQPAGRVDPAKPLIFADQPIDLRDISFNPNRIQFRVSTHVTSRIYLNERYTDGWRSDAGALPVDPTTGLAYVTVAADTVGKFSFWFVPPGLVAGVVLFAIGVLGAVRTGLRLARRRPEASLRF